MMQEIELDPDKQARIVSPIPPTCYHLRRCGTSAAGFRSLKTLLTALHSVRAGAFAHLFNGGSGGAAFGLAGIQ